MLNLPIKILATQQIETASETITFTGINTLVAQWDAIAKVTSRHLVLIINAKSVDGGNSITNFLRFNADAGMNYSYQRLSGADNVDSAGRVDGANAINLPPIPGNAANLFGGSTVLIPHAFNTTNHKAVLAIGGGVEWDVEAVAGRWASVAAITSVTVFEGVGDDLMVGSTVHLGVVDERYLVEEWISAGVGTAIFDNIPQGEGDLVVVGYARSSQAANEDEVLHYINDDAAAHPAYEMLGRGAARTAGAANGEIAMIPGQTAGINIFGALAINYSQYIKENQPHFVSVSGYHSGIPLGEIRLMSGRRDNIEPINKIELDPTLGVNFFTGSLLSLYRVPKRLIERQVLTAAQAVITLDNIPQNFEAIQLTVYAQTDRGAASDPVRFTINADAVAANYNKQELYGFAGAVTALRTAGDRDWMLVTAVGVAGAAAGEFGGGVLICPGYAETDRHKHAIGLFGSAETSIFIQSSRWLNTDAITSIAITPVNGPNFVAGTIVELEGILRKEGLPPSEGMSVD
jgi:hypothetical protein